MILLYVSTELLSILFFPHNLGQYLIWETDAKVDYELYQKHTLILNNDSLKHKWSVILNHKETQYYCRTTSDPLQNIKTHKKEGIPYEYELISVIRGATHIRNRS